MTIYPICSVLQCSLRYWVILRESYSVLIWWISKTFDSSVHFLEDLDMPLSSLSPRNPPESPFVGVGPEVGHELIKCEGRKMEREKSRKEGKKHLLPPFLPASDCQTSRQLFFARKLPTTAFKSRVGTRERGPWKYWLRKWNLTRGTRGRNYQHQTGTEMNMAAWRTLILATPIIDWML